MISVSNNTYDVDFYSPDLTLEKLEELIGYKGIGCPPIQGKAMFEAGKNGFGNGWIVELGTFQGAGTSYFAAGSKCMNREKVLTIDYALGDSRSFDYRAFWESSITHISECARMWLMLGLSDWIVSTRGILTADAAKLFSIPVRALFIDAGHTYPEVIDDINLWGSKVISGGIIIFDNYDSPEVKQAIDELIVPSSDWLKLDDSHYRTVTVVRR